MSPQHRLYTWILSALGLALLTFVVLHVGPATLLAAADRARSALLLAAAMEGSRIALEGLATLWLFQPARWSPALARAALKAQLLTYAIGQVAPAGRAASEGLKASMLTAHAPITERVAVAISAQSLALTAIGVVSIPCMIAAAVDSPSSLLPLAIGGHALVATVAAASLLFAASRPEVSQLIARRWPELAGRGALHRQPPLSLRHLAGPLSLFTLSRALQLAQIALLAAAIGVPLSPAAVLSATGAHLAGAGAGDFIPAHLGASEGALALGASGLGMSVEVAVGIALLLRVVQVLWIAISVGASLLRSLAPLRGLGPDMSGPETR